MYMYVVIFVDKKVIALIGYFDWDRFFLSRNVSCKGLYLMRIRKVILEKKKQTGNTELRNLLSIKAFKWACSN